MKIVQLTAENIKRLVAVEIRPDGNLVEITGRNGQGKTSVLDAIWWAFSGTKPIQTKPVHDGADSGYIKLDLGDYRVTRKFKVKDDNTFTTSLTVENADGAKYSTPQDILNSFIGDLSFDPLAFSRMDPKEQLLALRKLVPDFDFDEADAENKRDFARRTEINRTIKDLTARIGEISIPEDAPTERVSVDSLMQDLQNALDHNDQRQKKIDRQNGLERRIEELETANLNKKNSISVARAKIAELEREIKDLEGSIVSGEQAIEELRDEVDSVGSIEDPIDLAPIREKIANSESINRVYDLRQKKANLTEELKQAQAESDSLTDAMASRKAAAEKAVREANLPVPGLQLTEDSILLNGQPFDQASDAEQLRVSIAVAGAMNPKLRVIRVRDGSLLDDDAMRALAAYADENDLQVWIERVDSSGKVGVVIEDGRVRGAETPVVEAAE